MAAQALQSVAGLLLLMAVGWYFAGAAWFGENGGTFLSKYASHIAIPSYMFINVLQYCGTRERLAQLFYYLPIPFAILLAGLAVGVLLARLLRVAQGRRGVFVNAVAFTNTVFIGFPVITSLFGESAAPDGMIYYAANTLLFWTVGTWLLRCDSGGKEAFFTVGNLKKVASPALIALLLGVAAVLLGVSVPGFLYSPLERLAQTTTPIAMLFIGCVLRRTGWKGRRIGWDLAAVLLVRLVVFPLLTALVCAVLPVDRMMKRVFFVLGVMPAMTQLGIMAQESESDVPFASLLVALTSVLCTAALPLYLLAVEALHLF